MRKVTTYVILILEQKYDLYSIENNSDSERRINMAVRSVFISKSTYPFLRRFTYLSTGLVDLL